MIRDVMSLNYKQIAGPILISFIGLFLLIFIGTDGLMAALAMGLMLFAFAMNQLMGKNVVGDNAVIMNLLPVPTKLNIGMKVFVSGSWVCVISSVPAFLMMKNGGFYIDQWLHNVEEYSGPNLKSTIFYRDLLAYDYAVKANPSAMDIAVGDLMDGGASVAQAGLMAVLIPIILFVVGCFFASAVLICQLYLYPLIKKVPTMVVSVLGIILAAGFSVGVGFCLLGLESTGFFSLFVLELLLLVCFGGGAFWMSRAAVKRMESGFDI